MSQTLQSALESGQEARIVQIDFSPAFDRVNHQGILYRLFSVRMTFIPMSVSLWNDLSDPVFDGVRLAGFKSRANAFLLA